MSSWLLSPRHYQVIRDGLYAHLDNVVKYTEGNLLSDRTKITKFVRALASMNAAGFNCRYGEAARAPALPSRVVYKPTLVQLLKALHCVRYQASEGDTLTEHKKVMDTFNAVCAEISYHIISNTREFNDAPWSINSDTEEIERLPDTYVPLAKKTVKLKTILKTARRI